MELWPVPACAERGSVCWGAQGLQLVPRTSSGPRRHLPCRPLALSPLAARLSAAGRAVRMRHENGAVRGVRGGSLQGLGGQSGAAVWESGKPPGCPPAVTWARTCHLPQAGREMVWAKSHPEARRRHGAGHAGPQPPGSRREHRGTPAPETGLVALACGGRAERPGGGRRGGSLAAGSRCDLGQAWSAGRGRPPLSCSLGGPAPTAAPPGASGPRAPLRCTPAGGVAWSPGPWAPGSLRNWIVSDEV